MTEGSFKMTMPVFEDNLLRLTHVDSTEWNRKVKALAERLGVDPVSPGEIGTFRYVLHAGDVGFDVFDLALAFLDKMDQNHDRT